MPHTPPDAMRGVFRWTAARASQDLDRFWAGTVIVGLAVAGWGAVNAPAATATPPDRVVGALLGFLAGIILALILVTLRAFVRAPYEQRNELRCRLFGEQTESKTLREESDTEIARLKAKLSVRPLDPAHVTALRGVIDRLMDISPSSAEIVYLIHALEEHQPDDPIWKYCVDWKSLTERINSSISSAHTRLHRTIQSAGLLAPVGAVDSMLGWCAECLQKGANASRFPWDWDYEPDDGNPELGTVRIIDSGRADNWIVRLGSTRAEFDATRDIIGRIWAEIPKWEELIEQVQFASRRDQVRCQIVVQQAVLRHVRLSGTGPCFLCEGS